MKKSRIIVPALAMLTLSVAASVTGTVAWFTASRATTMKASNLAAFNTDGDLQLTLTAGNQDPLNVSGKNIQLNKVRDFSYDIEPEVANGYTAILDSENNKVIGTRLVETPTEAYATINEEEVYYMNTFTGTFSTNTSSNSYLIFNNNRAKSFVGDTKNSVFEALTVNETTNTIYRALRISMIAGNRKLVWAPYTSLEANEVMHVKGAGAFNHQNLPTITELPDKTKYSTHGNAETTVIATTATENVKVVKNADKDPVNANTANASSNSCVLATDMSSGKPISVAFSIWFEGLDPACIATSNGVHAIGDIAQNYTTALQMSFYAIDASAFAA